MALGNVCRGYCEEIGVRIFDQIFSLGSLSAFNMLPMKFDKLNRQTWRSTMATYL